MAVSKTRTIDPPEQVVIRAFGVATIIVAVQLVVAAIFFASPVLFAAAIAPSLVAVMAFVTFRGMRAPAGWIMLTSAAAIAIDVGLTVGAQYRTLGLGGIIVLGVIAVMLSAQRWAMYMVAFASLIVIANTTWHRPDDLVATFANGMSLAIIFLIGASLAAWVRTTKLEADQRYRTLVQRAPISIWEEDFSAVGKWLDGLRSEGVSDLRSFLTPGMIREATGLIVVREVNQACIDLLEAHDASQLVGPLQPASISEETLASLTDQLVAVWEGTDHVTTEVEGLTFEGNPIEGILHWSAPRINGRIDLSNVIVSVTDVTPLKETQRRLANLIDSKDRFVASISHELRTPLTTVVGLSAELRDYLSRFQPRELHEMLDLIATQAADVGHIVEDLLVAARADIGTISLRTEQLEVCAVVREVAANHPPDTLALPCHALTAMADSTRLRQIIRNLLTNARRYGGDNVGLTAGRSVGEIWIEVSDDGRGIPADDAARIFLPYETAHHTLELTEAIGLGLAVARQLARLMDGDLTYERRGAHTVFRLTLPAPLDPDKHTVPEQADSAVLSD
ncbi:MAG TPA: HAMP domain-containing histidine kinase [Actinobacteria bacterium]|nr:aerobic respiration control sensor protein ArcB [bacterium BMS3Bbin01]HDH25458.1 HAMP domain-containing histidine kinase [Actinomycetota bacterium]